jgi:hypothetical protein
MCIHIYIWTGFDEESVCFVDRHDRNILAIFMYIYMNIARCISRAARFLYHSYLPSRRDFFPSPMPPFPRLRVCSWPWASQPKHASHGARLREYEDSGSCVRCQCTQYPHLDRCKVPRMNRSTWKYLHPHIYIYVIRCIDG